MKENKKKNDLDETRSPAAPMLHEGHRLKSRRDFLAQGFLGLSAFALAPSALSLFSKKAYGNQLMAGIGDCALPASLGKTPVIIIDLAGGGSLAGSNIMVGGAGGQKDFLASYETLGLPSEFHPNQMAVNEEMGLAFHQNSGILLGIRNIASARTRGNVDGAIFCTTSDDDTMNNPSNPMYWLANAGAVGNLRPLAGSNQSTSGGYANSPTESINPLLAPVRISSNQDAINLVTLGSRMTPTIMGPSSRIIDAASRLSQKKMNSISRRSLPEEIKELLTCSYEQTNQQISRFSEQIVSTEGDSAINNAFNRLTRQDHANRSKSIVKLALDGLIGAGTIAFGGFDYHDGTRITGDTRDFELGQLIGAIMESAAQKQKDVVVYLITDGGVSAGPTTDSTGKFIWAGDSGQRSASVMLVHKSGKKPTLRTPNRQIGHYKSTGSVNTTALLTSNSVVNASKAMVANYLALHGEEGRLMEIVGEDPFGSNLDRYLVFDKLR